MTMPDLILELEYLTWKYGNLEVKLSGEAGPLDSVELKHNKDDELYIELGCST